MGRALRRVGLEALERADAEEPEAILLDVVMPEMDGFATLAALRSKPTTARIPVILVTAKDKPADRARAESLGAAGMIAKPFAVEDLAPRRAADAHPGEAGEEVLKALDLGAFDHVSNPSSVPVLMHKIRCAVER